jgi:hypothetical protein
MAEEKKPSADIIAKWRKNVADPNVSEDIKSKFRNLLTKFGEAEVEVVKEVEKVVAPTKGTRGRKPSATTKKPKAKTMGATRGRKPSASTPKSADDIEKAKADLKKKTGKTEEECQTIIEQYRALRTSAKKQDEKVKEATAENRTRINKLKKEDNLIEGTSVKTADATIETAKVEVVEKIEKEIEIVEAKVTEEVKKEVANDTTLTPTEKKEEVKKEVEKKVKEKTKVIVKRVIVDTSAMLTAIASKLGEFDKDSQKEFLIKLRSDIDKLLTKYAFGGDVMGATQRMNITQSNMSSSSVNSFGRGGKTMYADGGLVEMFTANDDSDYVDDVLEQIKHMYSVDDYVLEQIVNDKGFDDVDELHMYFENAYFTYANSDADLGQEYVDMLGSISELGQDTLERYFDYKKFGLDLAYDYDEYSGHYFNQNYEKGGMMKSRYDNGGGVKGLNPSRLKKMMRQKIGNIDFYYNKSKSAYGGITKEVYFKNGFRPSFAVIMESDPQKVNERLKSWSKAQKKNFDDIEAVVFKDGGTTKSKFDGGGRVKDEYDALIGKDDYEQFYFLDYIFDDKNNGFKGATGTIVMPVHKSQYDYATSYDGILERYTDAMGEDEWIETLGLDTDDYNDDEELQEAIEMGIWEQYQNGNLEPFEEASWSQYQQMRALPEFEDRDEYPMFEVVGGGRIFGKNTKMTEIYNQDLYNKIREIEEFKRGGITKSRYDNGGGVSRVVVYDNGGESYDRYTIFTPDGSVYGMSQNPTSPQGFNQYLGDNTEIEMGSHLGKRLKEIPSEIKIAVMERMED